MTITSRKHRNTGYDENLQNVTLLVTKRARFFLRSFSWGNLKRNPKRRPPLQTTLRTSFLSLASARERNDPGLTNRGAGTSASRRALSASSVERTCLGRKRGRGYIGGINRIPIRGTCHLTASENLKSYSWDYSSPVTPEAELRHLLEKLVARFVHERRKILLFVRLVERGR